MASNGLVANQAKTEFMVLNNKEKNSLMEIQVGNTTVQRTDHTKHLSLKMFLIDNSILLKRINDSFIHYRPEKDECPDYLIGVLYTPN